MRQRQNGYIRIPKKKLKEMAGKGQKVTGSPGEVYNS